jgi:hypothetical protein
MPREKQHVFSARTTEEGLKTLNGLKARLNVNWDSLVTDAINAHYGVDVPKPPKAQRKPKAEKPKAEPKAKKKAKPKGAKNPKPVHKTLAQPKVEGIEGGESALVVAGEGEK